MACRSKCCAMIPKNLRCWIAMVLAASLFFLGASVWAMIVAGGDMKDNFKCIVDAVYSLLNTCSTNTDPNLAEGCEAASVIPEKDVKRLKDGVDYIDLAVAVPGALCFVFLFLTSLMALCTSKWRCCFRFSKAFVFLSNLVLILNMVFFIVLAALGALSKVDKAKTEWAKTTQTCTTSADDMTRQVTDAQAALATAQGLGQDTTAEAATLALATAQLATFTEMCVCMSETLDKLSPLLGPGALGVLACVIGFIMLNSLCCTMGCCCYRPSAVAPAAPPAKGVPVATVGGSSSSSSASSSTH